MDAQGNIGYDWSVAALMQSTSDSTQSLRPSTTPNRVAKRPNKSRQNHSGNALCMVDGIRRYKLRGPSVNTVTSVVNRATHPRQ